MDQRFPNAVRASGGRRTPKACAAALLLLIAIAATGCAAQALPEQIDGMRVDAAQVPSSDGADRSAYEYHVMAGEMAIQRGHRAIAAREYVAALDYSGDRALARRATRIALFAGEQELAFKGARVWAASAPESVDAQRTVTRLALANGDAEALSRNASLLVSAAASPDIGYRLLADVLSGDQAHADLALETLSRLAQQNTDSAPAQYALGVTALRYDRTGIAAPAAERALGLAPDWNDAILLQGGVWIRQGKTQKAQTLVEGLPGNDVSRAQYHAALARLLIEAEQPAAARDEFAHALSLQPDNADARYGLAVLSLTLDDLDRAEKALMRLYEDNERADDAAYYLGSIYEQREDYAEAQRWYQRVENGSHAFESQLRAVRMIYQQDDLPDARQRLSELRGIYPELRDRIYAAEGQLLYEARDNRAALEVYNHGLDKLPESMELRYGRSMAYERLGRLDAAEADLRRVLDNSPDSARALNALGYLLANHSQRYDEALGYIQRALDSDPANPAILDSMGWVQYRLGHLDKAQDYLERAHQNFPDPEVAAHLGEVLWQQGERDAARRIWQDALADNPDHPVLRETVARFE